MPNRQVKPTAAKPTKKSEKGVENRATQANGSPPQNLSQRGADDGEESDTNAAESEAREEKHVDDE